MVFTISGINPTWWGGRTFLSIFDFLRRWVTRLAANSQSRQYNLPDGEDRLLALRRSVLSIVAARAVIGTRTRTTRVSFRLSCVFYVYRVANFPALHESIKRPLVYFRKRGIFICLFLQNMNLIERYCLLTSFFRTIINHREAFHARDSTRKICTIRTKCATRV